MSQSSSRRPHTLTGLLRVLGRLYAARVAREARGWLAVPVLLALMGAGALLWSRDEPASHVRAPHVAANGESLAAVWLEGTEYSRVRVAFALADRSGRRLGEPRYLDEDFGQRHSPSVTWDGRGWAVTWSELHGDGESVVTLRRLRPDGSFEGRSFVRRSNAPQWSPRVLWAQDRYWLAWIGAGRGLEVLLLPVSRDLEAMGPVRVVAETDANSLWTDLALTAHGDELAMAWGAARVESTRQWEGRVYLARVRHGERPRVEILKRKRARGYRSVALASGRGRLGIAWMADMALFTSIADDGSRSPVVELGDYVVDYADVALAWTGRFFSAVWSGDRYADGMLGFRRLDADGAPVDQARRISDGPADHSPTLCWDSESLGLAYVGHEDSRRSLQVRGMTERGDPMGDGAPSR